MYLLFTVDKGNRGNYSIRAKRTAEWERRWAGGSCNRTHHLQLKLTRARVRACECVWNQYKGGQQS